jgi:hypothetical protein
MIRGRDPENIRPEIRVPVVAAEIRSSRQSPMESAGEKRQMACRVPLAATPDLSVALSLFGIANLCYPLRSPPLCHDLSVEDSGLRPSVSLGALSNLGAASQLYVSERSHLG